MNKIIAFLSTTPATIITTIIVVGLLLGFILFQYQSIILKFIKKKYDLYDENEVVNFVKTELKTRQSRNTISNKLYFHKLKQNEKNGKN